MASILKQETLTRGAQSPQPVAFNVEDVQTRAREYLMEIQQQAAETLERARVEAIRLRQEAKQQGIADAQTQVEQQIAAAAQRLSDERCRTAIASCEKTVAELTEDTSQWLVAWRNQTVELAAKIAEKLVRREMRDENELLRVWMEEALVAMRDARDVRVIVHPDDFAIAGRYLQKLTKSLPQAGAVEILPDPEIKPGGCTVRSNNGLIDQQLETQLQRLVDQLTN
ncbi:MAG: FliH/SctL family protein [Pirellulaceae bacterium]